MRLQQLIDEEEMKECLGSYPGRAQACLGGEEATGN